MIRKTDFPCPFDESFCYYEGEMYFCSRTYCSAYEIDETDENDVNYWMKDNLKYRFTEDGIKQTA